MSASPKYTGAIAFTQLGADSTAADAVIRIRTGEVARTNELGPPRCSRILSLFDSRWHLAHS
jgi:hypothetical protein